MKKILFASALLAFAGTAHAVPGQPSTSMTMKCWIPMPMGNGSTPIPCIALHR